jgi:hypothetical protein
MKNYKMFGIWICGITIIPCYYDWLRYIRQVKKYVKRRSSFIRFNIIIYRFRCLFDTHLKPY